MSQGCCIKSDIKFVLLSPSSDKAIIYLVTSDTSIHYELKISYKSDTSCFASLFISKSVRIRLLVS